jgi:esterase/lipase superfamily enzyme
MRKAVFILVIVLLLAVIARQAFRIQPTVYLMPTPAVMSTGTLNPFALSTNLPTGNEIRVFFATNRIPAGSANDRIYTVFPGDKLSAGIAHMRIGEEETTWQQILSLSTSEDNEGRPALTLERVEELARYPLNDSVSPAASLRPLIDSINRVLQQSVDKNITIYVHGANTNVYRACAQAAQYHHFTGRNSVVMAYLWPSAENLLGYGTDTRHARKSAPAFARLLTLLAEHTDARKINVLAYSAGAQIVSPALDILGRTVERKERKALRLGEVYFAAADIGVTTFVQHLQSYMDIPRNTSLAMNLQDSVLALSARRNRESRVGSPDPGDLSPEQHEWARAASTETGLSIIGVSAETVTGMRARSHDFWYSHPWVSSDVLVQFVFQTAPRERGLVEGMTEDGLRYWHFPPDYPQRIVPIVEQAAREMRTGGVGS